MFSVNEKTSKTSSDKVKILASNPKVNSDEIVYDYTLDETEVLFYIDISNCATESIEATKKSIHDFSEALFEHCDAAAIQIIGYDFLSNVSGTRIQEYSDSNGSEILINLTSVDEAIEKIETDTQVAENDLDMAIYYLNNNIIRKGLFSSECKNKYVFITSDSTLSLTQKQIGYWYNGVPKDTKEILEGMQYEGIHVNTLFSDNLLKNSRAVKGINHYKEACDEYDFGVYTKSSTGYFGNTGYARVYSDAITDIQSLSVMYTCSVSPNAIPSSVERNAFINSLPPSYDKSKVPAADSDGNVNFKDAAVKVGVASLDKNGNLVFKNMYNACDESDLTRNGYEQLTKNMEKSQKLVWDSFQITPFSDKILYRDFDDDGILDYKDANPREKYDEHFESTLGFVDNSTNDNIDEKAKNANELYDSAPLWNKIFFHDTYQVSYFAALGNVAGGKWCVDMPNAASFMHHFLGNSGDDYIYDAEPVIKGTNCGKKYYIQNINEVINLCESTVVDELWFISKPSVQFQGTDFSTTGCVDETDTALDWWFSIGDSDASMSIHCEKRGDTYFATVTYYLLDYYDWQKESPLQGGLVSDGEMYDLHVVGMAREFKSVGKYTREISWKKGDKIDETALDST